MALTSTGLTDNGLGPGVTTNFKVQYEDSLANQTNVISNANALLTVLETEFNVTTGWFNMPASKFGAGQRQVVNLNLADTPPGGLPGANNTGYGSAMNLDAENLFAGTTAAERVKNVFMAEWVEILMSLNKNWGRGNSMGEALSQYCCIIRFPTGHYSYYGSFVNSWLQSTRPDWVNQTEPTDGNSVSFGCALAFLFYLNTQLGFTIEQIISAGSPLPAGADTLTMATVYTNLTGDATEPFTDFLKILNTAFPKTSIMTKGNLDNPFPLPSDSVLSTLRYLRKHAPGTKSVRGLFAAKTFSSLRPLLNSDRVTSLVK